MNLLKKVSIIIPIFNTGNYLANCLKSILLQTYKNIEIIAVNDCSKDNSIDILNNFSKIDNRIKIVEHSKNLGLFQARITGVKNSTGDYICFVDSDDEISPDWIRLLLTSTLNENADIVIGNTVNVDKTYKYYFNNALNFNRFEKPLLNEEILNTFLAQKGACYHWHTIWNKLYSKKLWLEALPYLEKQDKHLIMTEDIAFSFVLFYFAHKLAFANCDCYYYFKRETASTSNTTTKNSFVKKITDVATVFDFLNSFVLNINANDKIKQGLIELKDKYYRIWCHSLINDFSNDTALTKIMLDLFKKSEIEDSKYNDFYFYQTTTKWNPNYENIKSMILNPQYKVVSFDIFDTLIVRPLWEPSDIFLIMGSKASKLLNINYANQFKDMRQNAESIARQKAAKNKEDITLVEIYNTFSTLYNIDKTTTRKLYELEIQTEKSFLYRRESGIELLEMAIAVGKKVILTSDMYLEKQNIKDILDSLNIKGYSELYLSSEIGLLKSTGNLFKYVLKTEKINAKDLIHIGDNWAVDVTKPKELGITTLFFAKTKEIFTNKIGNVKVGNCFAPFDAKNNSWHKTALATKDFAIRNILALVANKFFDKPNYSFNAESDYNGDMFFIGYYNLGMFMLGLAKWLQKDLLERKIDKINFLARDGYLPKLAFDKLCKTNSKYSNLKSEYVFASRKALMPYSMHTKLDFYSISNYIDIYAHCPKTVLNLMQCVIPKTTQDKLEKYEAKGIAINKNFTNYQDFNKFIDAFIDISYDENYYKKQQEIIKSYYKEKFTQSSAMFDVGYSGKLAKIINDICDKKINAYFIHNAAGSYQIANENGFNIYNFINYTPAITGVILEYFLSSTEGSCIGYQIQNNNISPIIENLQLDYEELYPIKTIQQGALALIDDYIKYFGSIDNMFEFNNEEVFAPMLYYLCNAKLFDIYFFNYTYLEDELYGCKSKINFLQMYKYYYNESNLLANTSETINNTPQIIYNEVFAPPKEWSKLRKAIFYFIYDKKQFIKKLKQFIILKTNKKC